MQEKAKTRALLVVGASHGIGLATVGRALAAGHRVRALARRAGQMSLRHERLERLSGDARDPAVMAEAVKRMDAVALTLGLVELYNPAALAREVMTNLGLRAAPQVTLFSEATRATIAAMQQQGARRLLVVTGLGTGESRGYGGLLYARLGFPLLLKRVYADKDRQEALVRASGLDFVIARPGILTSGPAKGRYRVLATPQEWRGGMIARADVADFLVRCLDDHSWDGTAPVLVD